MNFEMAAELLRERERQPRLLDDDVAVENTRPHHRPARRGTARWWSRRSVGARGRGGRDARARCKALGDRGQRARPPRWASRFASCTVPRGRPPSTFGLGDEMEVGIGIHGEPGRRRGHAGAGRRDRRETLAGRDPGRPEVRSRGRRVLLFVNGIGGTPLMELYVAVPRGRAGDLRARGAGDRCAAWSARTSRRSRWPARRSTLLRLDDEAAPLVGRAGAHAGAALGER